MPRPVISQSEVGCRHCGEIQGPGRDMGKADPGFHRRVCDGCGVEFIFTMRPGTRDLISEVPTAEELAEKKPHRCDSVIAPSENPIRTALEVAIDNMEIMSRMGFPRFKGYAAVIGTICSFTTETTGLSGPARAFLVAANNELAEIIAK